jgi:hypothetical protein
METKDPLNLSFYDDIINLFEINLHKNEELYDELHESYLSNQNTGFSLGNSKTSVETARTLSTIRATALSGTKMLFDAKRSLGDLELKKKQNTIDENKVENDKSFIRQALNEIVEQQSDNTEHINSPVVLSKSSPNEKKELEKLLTKKKSSGQITLTKNELAMRHDSEVEPVLDFLTGDIKAVKKTTNIEVKDYPIERFQINKIIKADNDTKIATTDKGSTIPIREVISNA